MITSAPTHTICMNCRVETKALVNLSDVGKPTITCVKCGSVQEIEIEDKTQPITKRR